MVSEYLVDTDWIIDALHGQTAAVETLENLAPHGLAVSLISYGELYEGAYWATTNREAHLDGLDTFLEGKELLPLTVPIIQRFGVLRGELPCHLRQQIGDMDLLIAATALEHDLILLTRNTRDFGHIPGLQLYLPPP